MKKLLLTILALVAMTTGAWAQTDYGFMMMGYYVNSSNYQSLSSGKAWSYDPTTNVLHLKDGTLRASDVAIITIYGNKNPTLIIQVDGNCKFDGTFFSGIDYHGNGSLTICGNGTLTMTSTRVSPQYIVVSGDGDVSMTIKDVTINMTAYGPASVGVQNHFSETYLDNCEINIQTQGAAWSTVNQPTVEPALNKCFAYGGYFYSGTFYYVTGHVAQEAHIKRTINSVSVTVEAPQIGNTPSTNIVTDSEDYYATIVEWYAGSRLSDDYIFSEGETYKVSFILKPTEGNLFWNKKEEMTAYVNGHPATVYYADWGHIIIQYTFPALSDTYDLWIAGTQASAQNRDDILGDGKVSFDPATNTLTLNKADIHAAEGYGIQSKLSSITIRLTGENSIQVDNGTGVRLAQGEEELDKAVICGGGSLNIKATSIGLRSHLDLFLTDGVKITSEADGNANAIGFQGWLAGGVGTGAPMASLTMSGKKTVLMTKGVYASLYNFHALNLNDGLEVVTPSGTTFAENIGIVKDNAAVAGEWVRIALKGDANFDGTVDIADVVAVLNAMASDSKDPIFNINGDKDAYNVDVVDIADVVAVLNIMAQQ